MLVLDDKSLEVMYKGLYHAFVQESEIAGNLAFHPKFVSNNQRKFHKVLTEIEYELQNCDAFFISVAFITMSGITPLLQVFKELEQRGVPGRILTTDYLTFSEPRALKKLAELKNIEVRMYRTQNQSSGFHTKGYIFEKDNLYRMIIGSSNLTMNALTKNKEWNTKLISTKDGAVYKDLVDEFEALWSDNSQRYDEHLAKIYEENYQRQKAIQKQKIQQEFEAIWQDSHTVQYEQVADSYDTQYEIVQEQRDVTRQMAVPEMEMYKLQPNSMQSGFIDELKALIANGAKRALLISATGTGKTYASAFALRNIKYKRALFLVHREQIAKQAIASYKKVFGPTRTFGLLSGNHKADTSVDYLFSTMQMMAKEEIRQQFPKDYFDVVVIDEAHRVGAGSYQRILDYFEPELLLGMTATPERTDNFDVFKAFDHNIAYEIRLKQALEEELLCPFHYFGISDIQVNNQLLDETKDFTRLSSSERINHIIEKIEYFGYSGDRVKGLIFCRSKEECQLLSAAFNQRGYRTNYLTGSDSQEQREKMISYLVDDQQIDYLDYIFTVDIFNEGVDIPEVNQVVLLRPTQSPIVFVQQLGRGLRKDKDKEYLVVLDFIGNYKNNYMIPIALSGDRSYNKDNIRKFISESDRTIPGASTIHFDEVSRKKIFESIDGANFDSIQLIKDAYKGLRQKLGRIPELMEFEKYGELDVMRILGNPKLGSYYRFLNNYESEYHYELSESSEQMLKFISRKFASGKRAHELLALQLLMQNQEQDIYPIWDSEMASRYGIAIDLKAKVNVANILTGRFITGGEKVTFKDCIFMDDSSGEWLISDLFNQALTDEEFVHQLKSVIEFGLHRYEQNYQDRYQDTNFVLYQKYTYEDVCRLLNWQENSVAQNIGGYKFDKDTNTFPVFINYHKSEDIDATINYEDRFINENQLIAISKSGRNLSSNDVQNFINAEERGIKVDLFVRKNKDDRTSKEFYYLGRMKPTGFAEEFQMKDTNKTAVEIGWQLETQVREDIYDYIVER